MDETSEPQTVGRVRNTMRAALLAACVSAGFVALGLIAGQQSATAAEDVDTSFLSSVVAQATGEIDAVNLPTDAVDPVSVDLRTLETAASTVAATVTETARAVEAAIPELSDSPAERPAPATPPDSAPTSDSAPAEPAVADTVTEAAAATVEIVTDASRSVVADASDSVATPAQNLLSGAHDPVVHLGHAVAESAGKLIDTGARPVVDVLDAADVRLPGQADAVSDLPVAAVDLLDEVVFGPSPLPVAVPLPAVCLPDASDAPATAVLPNGTAVPLRTHSDHALPGASAVILQAGVHSPDARSLDDLTAFDNASVGASQTGGVASAGDLPLRDTPSGAPYNGSPPATLPGAGSSAAAGAGGGGGSVALLVASVLPHPGWAHASWALADTSWCGGVALEPGSTPD